MSKSTHLENVTIQDVTHFSTSAIGQPTYLVVTDQGDYLTKVNSGLGYAVQDYAPRPSGPRMAPIRPVVTLKLNPAGRILDIIGPTTSEIVRRESGYP